MSEGFNEKTKEVKGIGDSILDYEIFELRALKDAEEASAGKDTTFSRKINWLKKRAEGIKIEEGDKNDEIRAFEGEYSRWGINDFKEVLRRLGEESLAE